MKLANYPFHCVGTTQRDGFRGWMRRGFWNPFRAGSARFVWLAFAGTAASFYAFGLLP